jgi:hypothetical protein
MHTVLIAILTLLLGAVPALAQAGSIYDWQSGNSYSWNRGGDGSTRLWGFNPRSGSLLE